MKKPLLEQWLDNYWECNVSPGANVVQMDKMIHDFVSRLLVMGDEQLLNYNGKNYVSAVTGKPIDSYRPVRNKT